MFKAYNNKGGINMLLMYGDINITEILKIHHHSYDTYSLDFKDNKNN